MLYYSLVNSHILYGILVWGSTNHSILQQLHVLQNKIIRIICNVSKNEHAKNNTFYHDSKLLKVKNMYHLEMQNLCISSNTINFQIYSINILHPLKQYIRCKFCAKDALVTATFIYMLQTRMLPKKHCNLVVPIFGIVCNRIGKIFLLNLKKQLKLI